MRADLPKVAGARDRRAQHWRRYDVGRISFPLYLAEQKIDLAHLETSHRDVKIGVDGSQVLQLDGQDVAVPASLFGQLVVGEDVGALLGIGQLLEPDHRNCFEAELLGGGNATMSSDDGVGLVDENRIIEPKGLNARCDLGDLLRAVDARIGAVRCQCGY